MTGTKLKNVVVITGVSSGIGLACARKYSGEGYTVIGLDERPAPDAAFPIFTCDISRSGELEQAVEKLDAVCESVKYLVNCAGIFFHSRRNKIEDMDPEEWDEVLRTNLTGTMLVTERLLPYMRRAGGDRAIVNLSSDQAHYPREKNAAYAVSKGGISCFSKACAVELLQYGIRVNVVSPASVKTDFILKLAGGPEKMEEIYVREDKKMPLGLIEPEHAAEAVYFFGSEKSCKITGQELMINGGLYL